MELMSALKQAEGRISMAGDKASQLGGKLDDLLFRAQKISSALKNKTPNNDTMFGYDLAHFRREVRSYAQEVVSLPAILGSIERDCAPIPGAEKFAQSLMRLAGRLHKALASLHSQALMAHQHIREADHKIEAWYLCQEAEELAQKAQSLPTIAQKIVILTAPPDSTPSSAPPAPPAP